MSDLIERLWDRGFWYTPHGKGRPMRHEVAFEAADSLEAKDKLIAELEDELEMEEDAYDMLAETFKDLEADNERLLAALQNNKERAAIGLDIRSERIDALNDIYEISREAIAAAKENDV